MSTFGPLRVGIDHDDDWILRLGANQGSGTIESWDHNQGSGTIESWDHHDEKFSFGINWNREIINKKINQHFTVTP